MVDTTPTKAQEIQYTVGIDDAFITMMTKKDTSTTEPTYDVKIYRLAIISKLKVKGNGKAVEKWASNKLFARVSRQTQHDLTLDHVGIPVELADLLMNKTSSHGVSFTTTDPVEAPFFGFGYIAPQSDGVSNGFWYPRVQMDPSVELDYETTSDEITIPDTSITMQATGLLNNKVLFSDFNSARGTAEDLTLEKFMSKVIYDESQLTDLVTPPTGGGGEA